MSSHNHINASVGLARRPRRNTRTSARGRFLIQVVVALGLWATLGAQNRYDPSEVLQRSRELESTLTVLTVALEPGFEDFEALATLRHERGARLVTLYVTNGESGPNDDGLQIPGEIAFGRRMEAYQAMKALGGYELFLNMPDFGSASDTSGVREWWPADTLRKLLIEMIQNTRPDLVLLPADLKSRAVASPRWDALRDDLRAALRGATRQARGVGALPAWEVSSAMADDGNGKGVSFSAGRSIALSQAVQELAASAASCYSSLRLQLPLWTKDRARTYDALLAPGRRALKAPDDGVPAPPPERLAWVADEVQKLTLSIRKKTGDGTSGATPLRYELHWVVAIMDSVDYLIAQRGTLSNRERKILLHWKEGLEELRSTIFGIEVSYQFADSVLLERQVTSLTVDNVKGVPAGGTTEIFFPDVGRRWIPGSGTEQRQELELGYSYQLISPAGVELDLPVSYGGRGRVSYGTPFPFFVFHTGSTRAENFFKKIIERHLFAPKLTVEPITPIVRASPGERVMVRMTNHSHDGLLDWFGVQDSLAQSPLDTIRLRGKESAVVDTLALTWSPLLENGDYRIPLSLGGHEVAYFAARKFDVETDSQRRIALVPAFPGSPAAETLRRLGATTQILRPDFADAELGQVDVVVLDERLLTMHPEVRGRFDVFDRFASRGGRVVILAQDAQAWNERPLLAGVRLSETMLLDAFAPVVIDSTHGIARDPNLLTEEDWQGWLFARSNATAEIGDRTARVVARGGLSEEPLIAVIERGEGEFVMVNLALASQFTNIHPGAYRLFANILLGSL